jgi:hypothetical protein
MESQPASTETWKRRATRLLRHCDVDGHFRIDDRGVWPVEPRDTFGDDGELKQFGKWRSSPDGNTGDVFGQWRPARVLAAKGYEIDPAGAPALPFPFDAKKLAAFMVNGMGAFVAEWYCDGDWDNGLSIEVLERSLPVDETWLRQTVMEAIDAYRAAKEAIESPDGEHPDPDEIVWQLLKTDDAPAAPPTGQQDAPERNREEDDSGDIRAGEVLDYALLASPLRLIDTFGNFTGMDQSWFSNLKDKPALMKARKVEGESGRNSSPPLFCPFEVMTWLTSAKRKTGRPISAEKAWELLERSFPKVYNKHSVADPRED